MELLAKYLPCKQKVLGLDSQNPLKKPGMGVTSVIPMLERQKKDPWGLLTNEACRIYDLQIEWESPSQKRRWKAVEEGTPCQPLAFTYKKTRTQASVHIHTHVYTRHIQTQTYTLTPMHAQGAESHERGRKEKISCNDCTLSRKKKIDLLVVAIDQGLDSFFSNRPGRKQLL